MTVKDDLDQRRASDVRLENIEASISRIDKTMAELSGAMITLARVEERLAASHDKVERLEREIGQFRELIRQQNFANAEQDKLASGEHERARWTERIVWALVSGALASAGYMGLFQ